MLDTLTRGPGMPATVLGVLHLRGSVLPLVEARPRLGLPTHRPADGALVLVSGPWRAALVIEAACGVSGPDDVQPTAAGDLVVGDPGAEVDAPVTPPDARGLPRPAWNSGAGGA